MEPSWGPAGGGHMIIAPRPRGYLERPTAVLNLCSRETAIHSLPFPAHPVAFTRRSTLFPTLGHEADLSLPEKGAAAWRNQDTGKLCGFSSHKRMSPGNAQRSSLPPLTPPDNGPTPAQPAFPRRLASVYISGGHSAPSLPGQPPVPTHGPGDGEGQGQPGAGEQ